MEGLNHRIKDLIIKHLKDELTIEDQLELQEWADASDYNRELFHRLTNPDQLNKDLKEYDELRMTIREKIDARLKTPDLQENPVPNIFPIRRRRWVYAVAAAALLFLFIISYFWLASRFDSSSKARPVPAPVAVRDVAPGGNKATLTLGNGSTIVLENAADGQLTEQGAAHITKQKNALSYTTALSHSIAPTDIIYNTLTTPRAGQFKVVLPDGTKVWLNNASSLRYPTSFSGTSREVELTGEAYFEVAKDPYHIFKVKANNVSINVLGTSFNIMAYADEKAVLTTLLEGSIKLTNKNSQTLLRPDEQAELDSSGRWKVRSVEAEKFIAWQKGFFHFDHAGIQSVMRQLARWYNVEVEYRGTITKHIFGGDIQRDLPLSTVLENLEKSDAHFSIEGQRVIVTQ